jgi:hypothetical protein
VIAAEAIRLFGGNAVIEPSPREIHIPETTLAAPR